jgi:hypothetical protein
MAQEISFANLETDAGLAHILSGEIHEILHDPTDLRATCDRKPFILHAGTETIKTVKVDPDQAFASASSEISGGASNANIGSANYQLTVARKVMQWQLTDLWEHIAPNGSIDLGLLANIIVRASGMTFTDILTALFPSLSVTAGSTTEQMSFDYMFDSLFLLNIARAAGPYHMVLSPHGWNQFVRSLTNTGGALQFRTDTQAMLFANAPGYKGMFGDVFCWDSDSVSLDGGSTYRRSAMYDNKCFAYTEMPISAPTASNTSVLLTGLVRIMLEHSAANALTSMYGDYYPAIVETEDSRGVQIRHLAA